MRRMFAGASSAALLPLLCAVPVRAESPPAASSSVEVTVSVAPESDGCMDHAVTELGLSGKRTERTWVFSPSRLHPALVPDGSFTIVLVKGEKGTEARSTASWKGSLKAEPAQGEIEERLRNLTAKMGIACGAAPSAVQCQRKGTDGKATPCPASK